MNLNKEQSSLFLALWFPGHVHGVGSLQPIFPNAAGEFEYDDDSQSRHVTIEDSPLSDLIRFGYMRVYDEDVGSIIFTNLAEEHFEEIRDAYMDMCRK